jgi:hypothetical protein
MFASRRGVFFLNRRRARPEIATTLSVAAATAAVAAAAVYFLDPSSGKRRRAQVRDRMVDTRKLAARIGRGTYQRATGMYRRSKRHLHAVADHAPF